MPQSQYKSNSELKFLARLQTGHYLGLLVLTVLLNFVITFAAVNFISALVPTVSVAAYIINYVLVYIVQVIASVLNVGITFIFMKAACNMPSSINDLFYGFKHDFVKALKIGALLAAIESICMIPVDIVSIQTTNILNNIPFFSEYSMSEMMLSVSSADQYELWQSYSVLYSAMMRFYLVLLVCVLISVILTLSFFPAYYMMLDFPDWSAATILKKCFEIMKGNKLRLFILYLSFIPIFLLSIFTCGLALIWVIPYMRMTETAFYLDIMAVRNKQES